MFQKANAGALDCRALTGAQAVPRMKHAAM